MSLGSKFVAIFGWTGVIILIAVITLIALASIVLKKRSKKSGI